MSSSDATQMRRKCDALFQKLGLNERQIKAVTFVREKGKLQTRSILKARMQLC